MSRCHHKLTRRQTVQDLIIVPKEWRTLHEEQKRMRVGSSVRIVLTTERYDRIELILHPSP